MSRILVVYDSKSGCTRGIAGKIASVIARHGLKVHLAPVTELPDPAAYDGVVVGSGVRAGRWHEDARKWVLANAAALRAMPVAFFTVGLLITRGASKTAEVRSFTDPLVKESGVTPFDVGVFAGWNVPEHFSFMERAVMTMMRAPHGDQRDWDAIQRWAEEAVPTLAS